MEAIEKRMTHLDMAIRIVGGNQGGNIKTLVDEALTIAQLKLQEGSPQSAVKAVLIANAEIASQKQRRAPEPHEFFVATFQKYDALSSASQFQLAQEAFKGKVELAEYRSSLTAMPANPPPLQAIGNFTIIDNTHKLLADSLIVSTEIAIDYFELRNVVFRNATIIYHGGPMRMEDVKFIDCHFVVANLPTGNQLLRAAALEEKALQVG
jgi:hypothetical protein